MRSLSMVLCSLLLLAPHVARANQIVSASFALSASDARVTVVGRDALRVERVRSEPGVLLVWFSGIDADARIDVSVQEAGIRHVKIRPSVEGISVVRVSLVDQRVIADDAIRIDMNGHDAVVSIARSALLPVVRAPVTERVSVPEISPARPLVVPASAPNDTVAPTPVVAARSRAAATTRAPSAAPSGPGMPVLLMVTALLAAVLLALKLIVGRVGSHPSLQGIEIVSQKRLGARHQLVVVRALGRDHLLSVQGDQLRKIASVPIGDDVALAEEKSGTAGMLDRIRDRFSRADAEPKRAKTGPDAAREVPALRLRSAREFDAELARAEQVSPRTGPRALERPSSRTSNEPSAIATLLELRRQVEKS